MFLRTVECVAFLIVYGARTGDRRGCFHRNARVRMDPYIYPRLAWLPSDAHTESTFGGDKTKTDVHANTE